MREQGAEDRIAGDARVAVRLAERGDLPGLQRPLRHVITHPADVGPRCVALRRVDRLFLRQGELVRHRPHRRLLEDARHRRGDELDLGLAQPREVPGAGDPEAELAGDEGVAAVGVRRRRDLVLVLDRAPELGDLEGRGLPEAGALEVRRVDVRAVLPEEVVESPGIAAGIGGADREAEGIALRELLGHRQHVIARRGNLRLTVRPGEARVAHHLDIHVEQMLRHVQRHRVALALIQASLPRRRQIVLCLESLRARRGVGHRLENAVAREVGNLDGVDQRQIGTLVGRHRNLQLGVEIRPDDPLLLHADAGLTRELIDQLVHDLAVGAGEPVPVGDRGLGLRRDPARAEGEHGRAERGGSEEATATE